MHERPDTSLNFTSDADAPRAEAGWTACNLGPACESKFRPPVLESDLLQTFGISTVDLMESFYSLGNCCEFGLIQTPEADDATAQDAKRGIGPRDKVEAALARAIIDRQGVRRVSVWAMARSGVQPAALDATNHDTRALGMAVHAIKLQALDR
jgi:hypothetical protein